MKKPRIISKNNRLIFLGIGGVGVNSLAKYCFFSGYKIIGYDKENNEFVSEIKKLGVRVINDEKKVIFNKNDYVIYTSALDKSEIYKRAKESGAKIIKRSELLASIISLYRNSVAVSGSHGKTTTTAMISHVLYDAELHPTCFIGGSDKKFGNYLFGCGDIAVTEACEYKKNFLDLFPTVSVVTNIDNDHMDAYGDIENLKKAFRQFTKNTVCIYNADDENSKGLSEGNSISVGIDNSAYFSACKLSKDCFGYSFTVKKASKVLGKISLKIGGIHNVYNALCCIAVCDLFGVKFFTIKRSLENFIGVKRREEFLGIKADKKIFADYAHHPKEISATVSAMGIGNGDVLVFQPHTYSRTKLLLEDFISSLKDVKNLVIYKTYPAREKFDSVGSAFNLYLRIKQYNENVVYIESPDELLKFLENKTDGIRVIFMGAGDVYQIAKIYVDK